MHIYVVYMYKMFFIEASLWIFFKFTYIYLRNLP